MWTMAGDSAPLPVSNPDLTPATDPARLADSAIYPMRYLTFKPAQTATDGRIQTAYRRQNTVAEKEAERTTYSSIDRDRDKQKGRPRDEAKHFFWNLSTPSQPTVGAPPPAPLALSIHTPHQPPLPTLLATHSTVRFYPCRCRNTKGTLVQRLCEGVLHRAEAGNAGMAMATEGFGQVAEPVWKRLRELLQAVGGLNG